MTTRPGDAALSLWSGHRTKHACNLVAITRTDGEILRFTDHDRALTFMGTEFTPVIFAGMSAERRESALRSGNQEVYGIIDGSMVVVPDLLGNRYRGAEVAHVVTDWRMPWLWVARHRKWIRSVNWTGSTFVATLEGRSQVLSRPAGGRFGGRWLAKCPYVLGGEFCRASIAAWTIPTAVVQTVTSRRVVSFTVASWAGSWDDGEYRDGEVEWLTGANAGTVSPILDYVHATRTCTLLTPTPFAIVAGDTATARVGCDGLSTTCEAKFSNLVNHGGDPLAPSASDVVTPAEDN